MKLHLVELHLDRRDLAHRIAQLVIGAQCPLGPSGVLSSVVAQDVLQVALQAKAHRGQLGVEVVLQLCRRHGRP